MQSGCVPKHLCPTPFLLNPLFFRIYNMIIGMNMTLFYILVIDILFFWINVDHIFKIRVFKHL